MCRDHVLFSRCRSHCQHFGSATVKPTLHENLEPTNQLRYLAEALYLALKERPDKNQAATRSIIWIRRGTLASTLDFFRILKYTYHCLSITCSLWLRSWNVYNQCTSQCWRLGRHQNLPRFSKGPSQLRALWDFWMHNPWFHADTSSLSDGLQLWHYDIWHECNDIIGWYCDDMWYIFMYIYGPFHDQQKVSKHTDPNPSRILFSWAKGYEFQRTGTYWNTSSEQSQGSWVIIHCVGSLHQWNTQPLRHVLENMQLNGIIEMVVGPLVNFFLPMWPTCILDNWSKA